MHLKVRSLANEESKFRDWNSAYQFTCASRGCWIPAQPFFQTQGAGTRTRLESSGVLGVRRSLRGGSLFCSSLSNLLPEHRIALLASRLIKLDGCDAEIHFRSPLGSGSPYGLPNPPSSSATVSHQRASLCGSNHPQTAHCCSVGGLHFKEHPGIHPRMVDGLPALSPHRHFGRIL